MPKLKCVVEQCAYNYDWLCGKNYIDVDGIDSRTKSETSCKSYVFKDAIDFSTEFAKIGELPRQQTEVYCDAINCVFEKGQKCYADRIEIQNVVNDKCVKDVSKAKSNCITHCKTFECKD